MLHQKETQATEVYFLLELLTKDLQKPDMKSSSNFDWVKLYLVFKQMHFSLLPPHTYAPSHLGKSEGFCISERDNMQYYVFD